MAKLDKIRWQCRRGLLELDLILQEFNRRHLAGLEPEQLERFEELLALPDNDLLDLAMGRTAVPEPRYHNVVQLLRAA